MCTNVILWGTFSFVVYMTQTVLGYGITLLGGKTKPLSRFAIVLRDAISPFVRRTHIALGIGIPLFSGKFEPLDGGFVILLNTTSVYIIIT